MTDIRGYKDISNRIDIDTGKIESIGEYNCPGDLYDGLISRVRKYHPSDDITMIEKAYEVARKAHEGQLRKSGEPYIIHPLYVATILADLELDKETIVAGLLHDVVEDTVMTYGQISAEFGQDVALLVDGVTKLKNSDSPATMATDPRSSRRCRQGISARCSSPWPRISASS